MKRLLTRLYPAAWRRRYEEELRALLEERGRLGMRDVVDLLAGALDARLHRQVREGALAIVGGGGGYVLPGRVSSRLLALALLTLVALVAYGQSLPLPMLPFVLPIGSHASPEAFASSQTRSGLPLLISARTECCAATLFSDGRTVQVVNSYRSTWGGWLGGGASTAVFGGPQTRPLLTVGSGGYFAAGSVPGDGPRAAWLVDGLAEAAVARVDVEFADGSRAPATLREGAFLWFVARAGVPVPHTRGPVSQEVTEAALGPLPRVVIAYDSDGAVLERQPLGHP